MSNVGDRLTTKEAAFAEAYALTGSTVEAARRAGLARPNKDAGRMLHRADVMQAVSAKINQARVGNMQLALAFVETVLASDKFAPKDRLTAAKIAITDYRGAEAQDSERKDASEMNGDELRDRIAKAQARLAELATPVLELEAIEPHDDTDEDSAFG